LSSFIVAAVLFGALLHATWNALIKAQGDRFGAAMQVAIGAGVIGLPAILYFPGPPPEAWPYIVASSVIHVGYFALVGYAYRHADLGVAYPLTRGSAPFFTAILAFLLVGEALPWNGWLAVVCIALGIVALSADALMRGGLTWSTGAAAFANAAVIVLYTLIDGLGARVMDNGVAYGAWMVAGTGLLLLIFVAAFNRRTLTEHAARRWPLALVCGVLVLGSYGIALWAMTRAPIGLVASLRETSVLIAAILGAVFFHEPFGPKRWAALGFIVGGIVLLRLSGA
jgi:drug/metabolite transporter (DMT)-like permease